MALPLGESACLNENCGFNSHPHPEERWEGYCCGACRLRLINKGGRKHGEACQKRVHVPPPRQRLLSPEPASWRRLEGKGFASLLALTRAPPIHVDPVVGSDSAEGQSSPVVAVGIDSAEGQSSPVVDPVVGIDSAEGQGLDIPVVGPKSKTTTTKSPPLVPPFALQPKVVAIPHKAVPVCVPWPCCVPKHQQNAHKKAFPVVVAATQDNEAAPPPTTQNNKGGRIHGMCVESFRPPAAGPYPAAPVRIHGMCVESFRPPAAGPYPAAPVRIHGMCVESWCHVVGLFGVDACPPEAIGLPS